MQDCKNHLDVGEVKEARETSVFESTCESTAKMNEWLALFVRNCEL